MQSFNRTAKCVKCGYSVISNLYVDDKVAARSCLYEGDYDGTPIVLRTCEDCQYRWKEAPFDAAVSAVAGLEAENVRQTISFVRVGLLHAEKVNGMFVCYLDDKTFGSELAAQRYLSYKGQPDSRQYGLCRIIIEQLPE